MDITNFQALSLLTVFVASLTGSLHCIAMCGGLVGYLSSGKNTFASQFSYHLGRGISYSILGVLAGLLGQSLNLVGSMAGVRHAAPLLAGILLLYWGFRGLLKRTLVSGEAGVAFAPYKGLQSLLKRLFGDANRSWPQRALFLGLLSALFPCGWLYAYVAVAASSASVFGGMLVMFAFWLGTLPALVVVGGIAKSFSERLSPYAPTVLSLLFIVAGLYSIGTHVNLEQLTHIHAGDAISVDPAECH